MARKWLIFFGVFPALFFGGLHAPRAQEDSSSRILVNVVLVQLNVAVTDHKGNYISGLRPEDFAISEDKIPQSLATFEEGNEPTLEPVVHGAGKIPETGQIQSASTQINTPGSQFAGANVFILFDTSNYMYRGFVFAQDAIADFIRSLDGVSKLAFYSYSRDLSRGAPLTADRTAVLRGVRSSVAGDDAALYNCLLLTVKDTARLQGRKVIVVFSNGPDNASTVPPEDVAELAQST
jgi:VWFA-related protein